MNIGDIVRENIKQPRQLLLGGIEVEVYGEIMAPGSENDWAVLWSDNRRTDQNEVYAKGNRKGEACLILVD